MHTSSCTRLLLLLLLALAPFPGRAQQVEADSLHASLLTCAPGTEAYTLYGHTAVRIWSEEGRMDWTFNYGVFSFNQSGFAWHFIMGRPQYGVVALPTEAFLRQYASEGRAVTEQPLRLTQAETLRLLQRMGQEADTPGWTYPYDIQSDNCTTRALAHISGCLDGRLLLPTDGARPSWRMLLHECAEQAAPWTAFGQDLLLGADADTALAPEAQLVLPLRASEIMQEARVERGEGRTGLLMEPARTLLPAAGLEADTPTAWWKKLLAMLTSPTAVALILMHAVMLFSLRQWRGRPRAARRFDRTAMLTLGIAGTLVCFLTLFSAHATVGSNRLVALLNPLPLLWLPLKLHRERKGRRDAYIPYVQSLLLLLYYCMTLSQSVPQPFRILAFSLLLRSVTELCLPTQPRPTLSRLGAGLLFAIGTGATIYSLLKP